jgi:hypothetical protein
MTSGSSGVTASTDPVPDIPTEAAALAACAALGRSTGRSRAAFPPHRSGMPRENGVFGPSSVV